MWWTLVLLIILVSLLLRLVRRTTFAKKDATLNTNGFQLYDCLSESDVNYLKSLWEAEKSEDMKKFLHQHPTVLKYVHSLLGPKYVFQDYIFLIEKSQIHTCHRDVNAKPFNEKQKYPSYTMLFFLEPMERCLDVVDKSSQSQNGVFLTDPTESVQCSPGGALLFDANLIHSGSINDKPNHKRIQMKLTHVEDLEAIDYFNGYNKKLDSENGNPLFVSKIQKHFSCQLPVMSDMFKSSAAKPIEEMFSKIFYGNEKFYDLKTL